jgi:hypothetical protein
MSSPALPRSSSPVNPMRQQLDELDALLQRMLALPVNQLEEAPEPGLDDALPTLSKMDDSPWVSPAPPPRERPASPKQGTAPSAPGKPQGTLVVLQSLADPTELTVANPDAGLESNAAPVALLELPAALEPLSAKAWGPDVEMPDATEPGVEATDESADVDEPGPMAETNTRADFLSDMPSPFLERHLARVSRRRASDPAWQRPLLWANQAFDALAVRMGAPGLFVLSPRGRSALGWIGLGMIAAALTLLVVDWIGWIW